MRCYLCGVRINAIPSAAVSVADVCYGCFTVLSLNCEQAKKEKAAIKDAEGK